MENAKETVKIGGEERPRVILPTTNEDGTPMFHRVKIKGYKKKQNQRPNEDGSFSNFYSWTFEVVDPKFNAPDGSPAVVFGQTNDEARRHYITKQPLGLLKLIIAVTGAEPAKGTMLTLDDLKGKTLRVSLEDKVAPGTGETYQRVKEYYADGKKQPPAQPDPVEDVPTINIDEEIKAEDLPF